MASVLSLGLARTAGRIKPVIVPEMDPTAGSDYVFVLGLDVNPLPETNIQVGSFSLLEQVFTPTPGIKTIDFDVRMRYHPDAPATQKTILSSGSCSLVKGGTFTYGSTSDSMILLDLGSSGDAAFTSDLEGRELTISGFSNAGNNGNFRVSSVLTSTADHTITPAGRYALIDDPTSSTVAETASNVTIVTTKFRWVLYMLVDGVVHAEVSEQEIHENPAGVRRVISANVSQATAPVTLDFQLLVERVT